MPARHRIVKQIRELKARALEVGQRRQRYGVAVPDARMTITDGKAAHGTLGEQDCRRRALLEDEPDSVDEDDTQRLLRLLTVTEEGNGKPSLRVFTIVGHGGTGKTFLVAKVFRDPLVASFFDCKAWITVSLDFGQNLMKDIGEAFSGGHREVKLQEHLRGRRFLIVLDDVWHKEVWTTVRSVLPGDISAHSACIVTTRFTRVAEHCSPNETIFLDPDPLRNKKFSSTLDKAVSLVSRKDVLKPLLESIIWRVVMSRTIMRMFLGLLYSNPSWSKEELEKFASSLDLYEGGGVEKMILFCYNDLPHRYKTCLLYLSILRPGVTIRRTSLIRRWVADNVMTRRDGHSALNEAQNGFDELLARGFLHDADFGASSKVKMCIMPDILHEPVVRIARDEGFVDTSSEMPVLSYRLSIRKKIQQQQLTEKKVLYFPCFHSSSDDPLGSITSFLEMLPTCSRFDLVKVLDLEGCKGLTKSHLKNICDKLFQIKYFSLRSTGITQLPKNINKLHYLETLDIRETEVQEFPGKTIALPLLKHLLAGDKTKCPANDGIRANEYFYTVRMPYGIGRMRNMQILSQIEVCNSDHEVKELGQLDQLRKLGVVVKGRKNFKHLLRAVAKLSKSLRSLSISVEEQANDTEAPDLNMTADIFSTPRLLQNLHINGITSGLPVWIHELTQLTSITLQETLLSQSHVRMLGKLASLSCVRFRYKAYMEIKLSFLEDEFKTLKFLFIEGSHITNITFAEKSAPVLEKISWSFTSMESLSGISHLIKLKKLELNGDCNLDPVKASIAEHPNHPVLRHNPL